MTNKYGKMLSKNVSSLKTQMKNQSPDNCASCNNSSQSMDAGGLSW